ncbi:MULTISPECIES: DnaA regulatory inactivator Hda [Methylomonas]|uniref:DnaA regulatory inactivator Hda n=1 Tax=Methylomonas TaxID=416 RepID=UPI001231EFC7|nr:DnaA regulatory inactivator Hda [Methylomonas rhizoryzae]
MPEQLIVQFEYRSDRTFAGYYPGANAEVLRHLQRTAIGEGEQQIFLWGSRGGGKSHLLQACCQFAKAQGKDTFYLDLSVQSLPNPNILDGLEHAELVCLDDIHKIAGQPDWELALFRFYNAHRQNDNRLILSAESPPKYLALQLPDLKTRMAWGLTLKIQDMDDVQLSEALRFKARYLGFDMPTKVARFLIARYVHDLTALWQVLAHIDKATLSAHRKLTIPFLKQILADKL